MARTAKASRTASVAPGAGVASTKRTSSPGAGRRSALGAPAARSVLRRALDAPEPLSIADVEALQRNIGNRSVVRLLTPRSGAQRRTTSEPATLQRRPGASTGTSGIVQRNGNIHTLDDLKKKEGTARLTLRLRSHTEVGDYNKSETETATQRPAPTTSAFSGEGHRLSDWSFESNEERESERRAALATAQARYSAGLAPFEGETDLSRIPWGPRTDERSSSPTRVNSVLESAIRSRRPFSSGATESDIDPLGHIQETLIPSSPSHGPVKSELRKRRQFVSGASDEYVELKSARAAYQQEVDSTILNRRREQPQLVGTLERLWNWTNADIDDTTEETQYRYRQLPRIEQLLITIDKAHTELESRRKEAHERYIQRLLADIAGLSAQVELLLKGHHGLLKSNSAWWKQYDNARQYFAILSSDTGSQNEENLVELRKTWQSVHGAAQREITGATSSSTSAVKIGLDPFNSSDNATVYSYYVQTGGIAPQGQVQTVCQKADKYGGTYTYRGKSYDMYHDSHGPKEGNSSLSRTAWKILIDDKLQVVGVGHHISGSAKYQAIFPYSTDPSVQEFGPSPSITDSRK